MTALLTALGFNLASPWGVYWLCTAWTFFVVTLIWLVGLVQGNHSVMDGYYGFGYAIPVWIAYFAVGATSATAAAVLVMSSLHGCRLGYYLCNRWVGYRQSVGGDPRYLGFVKQFSPGYWWKSFLVVMEPQAVIIAIIGMPATWGVIAGGPSDRPLGWLAFLGILVFGIGYYYETVADGQLQAFKADPVNKGRYLRTGVWTTTRHPNYFGNTLVWWGIWVVAVAGNPSIWWTVVGPVTNTIMLTSVLGKTFQDRYMGERPAYRQLIAETNGFLPFPRRRTGSDAAQ
jgi:steroid 5-alpha reductase family enzyme